MRKPTVILLGTSLALSAMTAVQAAEMYPWRQHKQPLSFVFGNEIDGHQQTREGRDGNLNGYLYVQYTGVVTKDNYPVATHVDCNAIGADCFVGWKVAGIPVSAMLVRQPTNDHPVFLIGRADIPQPGSYTHFHWKGAEMPKPYLPIDGYLLELTAMNSFCFIHHDVGMAMGAKSCREGGGVKVDRGVDIATHLNIVTNDPNGK
jgi:hypothetical protein